MQTPSKNAIRKARRYGPDPAPYAVGENRAYNELTEGSGVVSVAGFGVIRCRDGSAWERKRAARAAGVPWRCGVNVAALLDNAKTFSRKCKKTGAGKSGVAEFSKETSGGRVLAR